MQKIKNTVPVIDICSLEHTGNVHADIMISPFGAYLKVHPNLHLPHGHSFYHLVLFTKGGGFHTIDFERFPVYAGQIYFMIPGQVHSWEFEGDTDGYVVNFSDDFLRPFLSDEHYLERFSFLSGNASEDVIALPEKERIQAVQILKQAIVEINNQQPYSTDMVRMLLFSLFIIATRCQDSSTGELARPNLLLLHNFRKLINQYYRQYKLPKDYAAMLYVTPNYLSSLCVDLLGKSAGELIRERILLEAKRKLVNTDARIAEIADDLGFEDNSYFTKFFKKYTGKTPEEFKRSFQSNLIKNQ